MVYAKAGAMCQGSAPIPNFFYYRSAGKISPSEFVAAELKTE